ncbi:MAG: FliM/FliN family flagellar motor switch protein [Paracoccaceae bacterium]
MAEAETGVIRKRLLAGRVDPAEGVPGADRAWRLALARAARDLMKLPLEVTALSVERYSLAELLELPPKQALIGVLEGPAETMGLFVADAVVLAALIEVQTLGRVSPIPPLPRRPTRTDAAMVAELIDAALKGLEAGLEEEADLVWAGGFRYASFLEEARPLALLLEDAPYRVLRTEVSLAGGAKSGTILLAVPALGRGRVPVPRADLAALPDPGPIFAEALAERVEGADCAMDAVLARLTLPIVTAMSLQVGEVLPLPLAALDRITLEGIDGRRLSMGKLGQNRGMRAVRLTPEAAQNGGAMPGTVLPAGPPVLMRATGTR